MTKNHIVPTMREGKIAGFSGDGVSLVSVPSDGTYTLDADLTVQGVYAETAPTSHPEGITWAAGVAPTKYPALLVFVRVGGKVLGYAAGAGGSPENPAPVDEGVPAPAPQAVVSGKEITVSWEPVPGATGYEVSVNGGAPTAASSPYRTQGQPGETGTIRVRALKDSQQSPWASVDYAVPR